MARLSGFLRLLAAAVLFLPGPGRAQSFGVAGSPVETIEDRDYLRLFTTLKSRGIDTYFPTFQFQELPHALSLGYEIDFMPPCTPGDPAFAALRASGMTLLLPGELLYPDAAALRQLPMDEDPLRQVLSCAGPEHVAAITTYDEAIFNGRPIEDVAAFYARVKAVAPELPVLMVHAPILTDDPTFKTLDQIQRYLKEVTDYSAHADAVGFDIYPVPADLSNLATPVSGGAVVAEDRAVADYLSWLEDAVPARQRLVVLQGFGYADLYESKFLEASFPAEVINAARAPTGKETDLMVSQAISAGAEWVIWWGPSLLKETGSAPWQTILDIAGRSHN